MQKLLLKCLSFFSHHGMYFFMNVVVCHVSAILERRRLASSEQDGLHNRLSQGALGEIASHTRINLHHPPAEFGLTVLSDVSQGLLHASSIKATLQQAFCLGMVVVWWCWSRGLCCLAGERS